MDSSTVYSFAFNHNGTILATGYISSKIKLWNMKSQTEIVTLEGHSECVNSVAFNQSGTILASGSDDNTIKLWNVKS